MIYQLIRYINSSASLLALPIWYSSVGNKGQNVLDSAFLRDRLCSLFTPTKNSAFYVKLLLKLKVGRKVWSCLLKCPWIDLLLAAFFFFCLLNVLELSSKKSITLKFNFKSSQCHRLVFFFFLVFVLLNSTAFGWICGIKVNENKNHHHSSFLPLLLFFFFDYTLKLRKRHAIGWKYDDYCMLCRALLMESFGGWLVTAIRSLEVCFYAKPLHYLGFVVVVVCLFYLNRIIMLL